MSYNVININLNTYFKVRTTNDPILALVHIFQQLNHIMPLLIQKRLQIEL
jgi:hypothetical protein